MIGKLTGYIIICSLFIIFLFSSVNGQNHAPIVTNVDLVQRMDGSKKVDIYYDVSDADGDTMTITVKASSDSGATWVLSCDSLTGAVGGGITSGVGKQIIWDVLSEHPIFYNDKVIVEIWADDGKFSCGSTLEYAGKTYNTVKIGNQCWLKENLNVGTMINSAYQQTSNGIIEKYCYYNDPANCNTYGGLYEWREAMQYSTTPGARGICPVGWHIPTYAEFETLKSAVNNNGNSLKAVGQGYGGGAGTNTSGFSVLLAGSCSSGYFGNLGLDATFWSSTKCGDVCATTIYLYNNDNRIALNNSYYPRQGFSVRCLKD